MRRKVLGERKYIFQSVTRELADLKILENISYEFLNFLRISSLNLSYFLGFIKEYLLLKPKRTSNLYKNLLNNAGKWLGMV